MTGGVTLREPVESGKLGARRLVAEQSLQFSFDGFVQDEGLTRSEGLALEGFENKVYSFHSTFGLERLDLRDAGVSAALKGGGETKFTVLIRWFASGSGLYRSGRVGLEGAGNKVYSFHSLWGVEELVAGWWRG